jgi:hypothetical protein
VITIRFGVSLNVGVLISYLPVYPLMIKGLNDVENKITICGLQ